MKKILMYVGVFSLVSSTVFAGDTTPKTPTQIPAGTALSYVENYKRNIANPFAHGYLLDIASTAAMSTSGVRVYNGLNGDAQQMVIAPLNSSFKVSTNGACYMQSDERICPKYCDIIGMEPAMQISGSEVSTSVNVCMDCRKYETVNAMVVHTKTLNSLKASGFKYVRVYNGMDEAQRRYVVYMPVDAQGKDVAPENVYVGDWTSTIENCKYP